MIQDFTRLCKTVIWLARVNFPMAGFWQHGFRYAGWLYLLEPAPNRAFESAGACVRFAIP